MDKWLKNRMTNWKVEFFSAFFSFLLCCSFYGFYSNTYSSFSNSNSTENEKAELYKTLDFFFNSSIEDSIRPNSKGSNDLNKGRITKRIYQKSSENSSIRDLTLFDKNMKWVNGRHFITVSSVIFVSICKRFFEKIKLFRNRFKEGLMGSKGQKPKNKIPRGRIWNT